ncbi:LCP family protein [Actinomyces faecalis]|uniref:LCP family protein n=1 Tax=Actinomyces faecalis TaxID=2722820 RepID=UPI001FD1135F|nr:LCP family protein [Actinomyces faecalis]
MTTSEEYLEGLDSVTDLFEGMAPEKIDEEPPRRRRRRKKAAWYKRHKALTVVLVLFLVMTAGLAGGALWLRNALGEIGSLGDPFAQLPSRAPYATSTASKDPVTFLVLGSDSRIDTADPAQWEVGAQRTDTIMLVQIAGDRRSVNVMSIPRDSWVTIPANEVVSHESRAKINAAYSWGGPTLLIQTIENNTGIHIDHFAITNFESFKKLTDDLGGVEIALTQPLDLRGIQDAATSNNVLEPGTHTLTGEQALIYARERYTLPNGDFDRIKRQQNWMRAMLKATISKNTLTNPSKLASLVSTIKDTMATDKALTASQITSLAASLKDVRADDVSFFQAPVTGTSMSEDGQSIVLLDLPALAEVAQAFQEDVLTDYVAKNADRLNMLGASVS